MPTHKRIEHEWIWRVSWRATAVKLKVLARTQDESQEKAERMVKKMLGGLGAMDLTLVDVRRANVD